MGKFDYEKGDIQIVDCECRLCVYYAGESCENGEQPPDGDRLCPYFERKGRIKW